MKSLSNTLIAVIIALSITTFVGICLLTSFGTGLESYMADTMQTWRYDLVKKNSAYKTDPRLVFVAVDQQSVSDLGRWPFPRSVHGQLLQLLAPEKPAVVAWDIFFTERSKGGVDNSPAPSNPGTPAAPPPPSAPVTPPSPAVNDGTAPASAGAAPAPTPDAAAPAPSTPSPDASTAPASAADAQPTDDQVLVEGAKAFPHMVSIAVGDPATGSDLKKPEETLPTLPLKKVNGNIDALISSPEAVIPFPELRQVSYFGFGEAEGNESRRVIPLVVNIAGQAFASFDLQTLMQFLGVGPDEVTVNIGRDIALTVPDGRKLQIPIDAHGRFLVNYRGRTEDFHGIRYSSMGIGLDDRANHKTSPEASAIPPLQGNIVMIGVALAGTDTGPTPIDPNSPLVVAHLNVLNNILQQDYLYPLSVWIWFPIYGIFLFFVGNLMLRVGIAPMIPIGLFAMALLGTVAFCLLWLCNWEMPVAMPEIGVLVLASVIPTKRFFGEEREKRRVKGAMSAHLSEKVMQHILAHPDNVKLGGSKKEITVLFCDIRGFTAYCDHRDSAEVMDVLNEYMEEMTQVVHKYDGTVDKYIGDCIMAFWNAPQPQEDHAQRAVCCAMEMRYALANFKTKRAGLDIELFECGIGIHTGEALVGNMGSSLKRSYTAMGSTVNLGARLEALTKRLNERILISEATLQQLKGEFPITDRGEATIPGFSTPVHVYAVGADQDITSALKVGRKLATKQEYTAEEVTTPIWKPAPLPEDE